MAAFDVFSDATTKDGFKGTEVAYVRRHGEGQVASDVIVPNPSRKGMADKQ